MLPEFTDDDAVKEVPKAKLFDRRHQMPDGAICLFQRETRGTEGGEWISGVDALSRAEQWFLGHHTGHWPPDSRESELEPHFFYAGDVLLSKTIYRDEIKGHGRFFMVRDVRRILDRVGDEDPPLIVTCKVSLTAPQRSLVRGTPVTFCRCPETSNGFTS